MSAPRALVVCAALAAGVAGVAAQSPNQYEVFLAMGLKPKSVLTGTVVRGDVLPDPGEEVVAVATWMTGAKDKAQAVAVRFAILTEDGSRVRVLHKIDYGDRYPGGVGRGEIELLDVDGDGLREILVTFDDYGDRLIERRRGEFLHWTGGALTAGWEGEVAHDSTREAREVPPERRDRFVRTINYGETLRTRGVTLYFDKKVYAVAGETLAEPKVVLEPFPLKAPPVR